MKKYSSYKSRAKSFVTKFASEQDLLNLITLINQRLEELKGLTDKMESTLTKVLYIGYAALTGLTLSSIFIVYELTSIIWIFLASALVFGIFSLLGKSDKFDLSHYGIYLFIALLGSIILEVINIFLMNQTLNIILCITVLCIFVVYVAYDIQKIIKYYDDTDNMAIIGAFNLYLDFINIFIRLLQLFGKNRD